MNKKIPIFPSSGNNTPKPHRMALDEKINTSGDSIPQINQIDSRQTQE